MDIATNLELFIPLEDYVEKYCPNIQAVWEAEPTMEKMVTNRMAISTLCPVKSPCVPRAVTPPSSTRSGWTTWAWSGPRPWRTC